MATSSKLLTRDLERTIRSRVVLAGQDEKFVLQGGLFGGVKNLEGLVNGAIEVAEGSQPVLARPVPKNKFPASELKVCWPDV